MKTYAGIDLHSSNSYLVIIDDTDKRLFEKRLSNTIEDVSVALEPYRSSLTGVVVESTYNWYWLVDGCRVKGFRWFWQILRRSSNTQGSNMQTTNGIRPGWLICEVEYLTHRLHLPKGRQGCKGSAPKKTPLCSGKDNPYLESSKHDYL